MYEFTKGMRNYIIILRIVVRSVFSHQIPERSRGTLQLTKKYLTNFLIKLYQYLHLNLSIYATHNHKCLELFSTRQVSRKQQIRIRSKKQIKLGGNKA